jgi:hypothetical protein
MARIGPRRSRAWDNQAISLICQFLSDWHGAGITSHSVSTQVVDL